MQEIIIATANRGKLGEIGEILKPLEVKLSSLADYWDPVPAIPETGWTFLENAFQKARWVTGHIGGGAGGAWVLADDSGLEVDALDGRPGVMSARFAGEPTNVAANNKKLLELLARVPAGHRTARFKCAAVLMTDSAEGYFTAEGVCEGAIAFTGSGAGGFGYDPLFIPEGFSKTFAELKPVDKNAISHRGRALEKIRNYCRERLQ
jgi:XTP/dITP diphosphohydrolase